MPSTTRYVETDEGGWLRVWNDRSRDEYLCAYTQVVLQSEAGGRTSFKVLDGPLQGKVCSLKSENARKHLVLEDRRKPAASSAALLKIKKGARKKVYSAALKKEVEQQTATLLFNGRSVDVTLNSVWKVGTLGTGTYKMKIPSWSERQETLPAYKESAPGLKYDRVRFRLVTGDTVERYVHAGHESAGGVAVLSLDRWGEVYTWLISHRLDKEHVGTLEVLFESKTLYVKTEDDGWLRTLDSKNQDVFLCACTQVVTLSESGGRTSFKVLDGPQSGKVLSLKNENVERYLGEQGPVTTGARLVVTYGPRKMLYSAPKRATLDQQTARMTFGTQFADVTLNSEWRSGYYPLPEGKYRILIPDAPHKIDYTDFYRRYQPSLRYDQVWFPIEFEDNSRFVHVGNVSEGCVTVMSLDKWNAIYEYLISHRLNNKYIGTLEVVEP